MYLIIDRISFGSNVYTHIFVIPPCAKNMWIPKKDDVKKVYIEPLYIFIDMKHLKKANMSYWEHWWHATTCGIALLIHAWLPNVLEDYASNKICKK